MGSPEGTRFFQWRRFAVDVLIAAAAFAIAGAIASATDALRVLLLSSVLVGLGVLIEPTVPAGDSPASNAGLLWRLLRSA